MKHILILASALLLIQCKTSKSTVAVAEAAYAPSEKEINLAQKNWPNTTAEELKEGNSIYKNQCTQCHKNFTITNFSEKKWKHEIDDMAPKAKLTDEQKLKLTKFILSFREANAVAAN